MPSAQTIPDTNPQGHAQLFVPNRLDLLGLKALELELGSQRPIVWLVEAHHMPQADIHAYLQQHHALGIIFQALNGRLRDTLDQILAYLKSGHYVVLLPPSAAQESSSHLPRLHHLSGDILRFLQSIELPLSPLYISDAPPNEEPDIQLFDSIPAGPSISAQLLYAWMEGAAHELEESRALQSASLPKMIISALRDSSDSPIINGVDESKTTYGHMLARALLLARHIRKVHHCSDRMGILLPPGANAICANLACFLAGITPVNINYKLDPHSSQELIAREGVKRFLTDKRTSRKLEQYKWLNPRDFVFVDSILKSFSPLAYRLCYIRAHISKSERLLKWLKALPRQLEDEALLLFSKGQEDGVPKATSISQGNLLAQLLQLQQQLPLAQLNSTLSSHPYHSGIGLFLGLLLPLISGQTIITYPIENKLEHLARLIDSHKVELAFTSPSLLHQLLENQIPVAQVSCLRYLISSGQLLNASLREKVEEIWQLKLLNAYSLTESGALVSIEQDLPDGARQKQSRTRTMCPVGQVLLGTAIRIGNPYRSDLRVPAGELGSLWLRGPSVAQSQKQWINTGDIASIDEQGLMSIEGRRRRFSRIDQELISHEAVEQLLYKYFRLPNNQERKLAVIGVTIKGHERLVMLSAAHARFEPNDQVTMRYGISNMKYPFSWSPSEVILVRPIPQLSNGQLDYKQCCRIAYKALGHPIPEKLD